MFFTNGLTAVNYNPWKSLPLLISVAMVVGLIVIGLALGLGLGIGLHNDSQNLTLVTSTTSTAATTATTSLITSTYSGALTTSSPTFTPVNQTTGGYYYQAIQLLVDTTGTYNITSNSPSYLYGYLYNNTFNPTSPSVNLITSAFDNAAIPNFSFSVNLNRGVVYILVITTVSPNVTGGFTETASGLGNAVLVSSITTTTTTTTTTTSLITSTYSGALTTSSPTFTPVNQTTSGYYYQAIQLLVDTTAAYTIASNSPGYVCGYLYNNTFTPTSSSVNLITSACDTTAIPNFSFSVNLNTGVVYILVITTVSSGNTATFTETGTGVGNVVFVSSITTTTTTTTTTTSLITSTYSGSLTTSSPTFTPVNQTTGGYYYQAIQFLVDTTAAYTIASNSPGYVCGYLYNNTFNPTSSSVNLITSACDTTAIPNFSFSVNLHTAVVYILVITTASSGNTATFTETGTGVGNVVFVSG